MILSSLRKKIAKSQLISGSVIIVGGSLFVNAINYIYHFMVGRMLGPSGYGEMLAIYSILYLATVVPTSTSFAIVKFVSSAETNEEKNYVYHELYRFIFKISAFLSLLFLILIPFLKNYLGIENYWSLIFVSPIMFFSLLTLVNQSTLQGVLNFVGTVLPNFSSSILKLTISFSLIFLGYKVSGTIFALLVASIISFLISRAYLGKKFKKKPTKNEFKIADFFKFALPVLVQALAFTSIFTFDLILVKHFFSPFEAGLYSSLSTLGKIIFFAAHPILFVMFPLVSSKKAKGEKYLPTFYLSLLMTVVICLPIILFYYYFPQLAIGILFGSKYLSASRELVFMGLFLMFYCLSYLMTNYFLSINRTKVVVAPFMAAILQLLIINSFHNTIFQVIMISMVIMILLFLIMVGLFIKIEVFPNAKKK